MLSGFAPSSASARRRNLLRVGAFALAGSFALSVGLAAPASAEAPAKTTAGKPASTPSGKAPAAKASAKAPAAKAPAKASASEAPAATSTAAATAPEAGAVVGSVSGEPVMFGAGAPTSRIRSVIGGEGVRSIADALEAMANAKLKTPLCRDAAATSEVPSMVANIFRCHLRAAKLPEDQVREIAAEAVLIAHCESLFDPDIVVFNGRYLDTPHPNGNRYSAAGVFQFIRKTADKWIDGGYANVTDPRRNIDAAARLYLNNRIEHGLRGWDDWACAAAHDGFKVGSVLPGWPGGPAALPEWVYGY